MRLKVVVVRFDQIPAPLSSVMARDASTRGPASVPDAPAGARNAYEPAGHRARRVRSCPYGLALAEPMIWLRVAEVVPALLAVGAAVWKLFSVLTKGRP